MADLDEALRLLAPWREQLRIIGPATAESIRAAQAHLAVAFPPSYRRFLEELGGGSILGREIYGVVGETPGSGPPDVVSMTLGQRSIGLPADLVVLVDMDDSSAYALRTAAADHDGESPVVRVWPGEPTESVIDSEVAANFGSFFLRFTRERISFQAQ